MTKTVITKTVITKSIVAVVLSALSYSIWASTWAVKLLNDHATYETQRLYDNLAHLDHRVLFGHEDSLAYGVTWQRYSTDGALDSDIKQVTGAFPGVFGLDVGGLGLGHEKNLDGVKFSDYRDYIKAMYRMGGVNTLSWHMYSPVDHHDAWTKTAYVPALLPSGPQHQQLVAFLDRLIDFNESLRVTEHGQEVWIPIIFRPWHEHNGDWFWWGKGQTTEADYKALWRFTVDYLNSKGQDNLIYAFSPDRSRLDMTNFVTSYLYGYPGDAYVDVIGYDNYWDLGHPANPLSIDVQQQEFVTGLEKLTDLAAQKGKVAALSEGGQEGVQEDYFWTQRFGQGIFANAKTSRIAYALVWRNNYDDSGKTTHYFSTYPGQINAPDFVRFFDDPQSIFSNNLPPLYQ